MLYTIILLSTKWFYWWNFHRLMTLFHHGSQTPGNTVKPVYNDTVYSGHPVYFGHRKTSQNFQWPYIFYKVDQYKLSPGIITVTLPFPKGDCCTQVWLYIVHVITQCKLTSNMLDWCTLASVKPGLSYIICIKYTVYRQALWHLNNARLSEKNLGASWPPSFHFLSAEQVFWLLKIIFKNYWI